MSSKRRAAAALAAGVAAMLAWSGPVAAERHAATGSLRIGVVARPGAGAAIAGATAIERAFSTHLGISVDIFVARDFPALIDAQVNARVDYAIYSAAAYAVAFNLCGCVEPLAAPTAADGSNGIRAVLVARTARGPGAGQGRVAIAAGHTLVGALLTPVPEGMAAGGGPGALRRVEAGAQSQAEAMFADGTVDAVLGWVPDHPVGQVELRGGTLARLAALGANDVEIAWQSETVRYGPHAVRKDMPEQLKAALRTYLTTLRLVDPDIYDLLEAERQGGFVLVSHGDYRTVLDAVTKLELQDEGTR